MAGVPDAGSPADLLMVLSDHLGGGRSSPVAQQRLMEVLGTLPTSCRGRVAVSGAAFPCQHIWLMPSRLEPGWSLMRGR